MGGGKARLNTRIGGLTENFPMQRMDQTDIGEPARNEIFVTIPVQTIPLEQQHDVVQARGIMPVVDSLLNQRRIRFGCMRPRCRNIGLANPVQSVVQSMFGTGWASRAEDAFQQLRTRDVDSTISRRRRCTLAARADAVTSVGVVNDHPCMKQPIHRGAQRFAIRAAAGIKAFMARSGCGLEVGAHSTRVVGNLG